MSEPVTIVLGGRSFAVRPLTIGQFREIYPAVFKGAGLASEEGYDQAIRCIAAALQRDHPAMSVDALLDLETNIDELSRAFIAIMRLPGLNMGEAVAGLAASAPGSAGPTSTAA
jgi:hypothetical protein